jgi:hypothetical protein
MLKSIRSLAQLSDVFKKSGAFSLLGLIAIWIITACSTPSSTESRNGLVLLANDDSRSVWATEADRQTARDILASIQKSSKIICNDLQTECQFTIEVEVYPDQASFDEYAMNPEMRGFFAISGQPHTIQMVSPANPGSHKIPYNDGVSVAVHEFVHLALDEINPDMPTWLDEGTAVYLGPHSLYTTVCQSAFPFELTPSFQQLDEDYNSVQAPDLFAYTLVDFIASQYGMDNLNLLLRSPDKLENILGVSKETFEAQWQQFQQAQYHKN